jgi:hypothetical protein
MNDIYHDVATHVIRTRSAVSALLRVNGKHFIPDNVLKELDDLRSMLDAAVGDASIEIGGRELVDSSRSL